MMAIVYGDFKNRVLRLLEDPAGSSYDDSIILDATRAAINSIIPWSPKRATTTLASGESVYAVPTDYLESEAVLSDSGDVVPQIVLSPSAYFGTGVTGNSWLPYPHGYITFALALTADYTLYYLAAWVLPDEDTDDTDELEVPDAVEVGLSYYAAAYALMPAAISIGEIKQFEIDTASGNPEHNPLQRSVDFLLKLWRDEMKRLPTFQKVG